jgi:hypothetical protein
MPLERAPYRLNEPAVENSGQDLETSSVGIHSNDRFPPLLSGGGIDA